MVRLSICVLAMIAIGIGATCALGQNPDKLLEHLNSAEVLESKSLEGLTWISSSQVQTFTAFRLGNDGVLGTDDDGIFKSLYDVLALEGFNLEALGQLILRLEPSSHTIPSPRKILHKLGIRSIALDFVYGETEFQIERFDNFVKFESAILKAFDHIVDESSDVGASILETLENTSGGTCCIDSGAKILECLDSRNNVFGMITRDQIRSQNWPENAPPNLKEHWVFFVKIPTISSGTYIILVPRNGVDTLQSYLSDLKI